MKYSSVFFDWGDTLAPLDGNNVPIISSWTHRMIHRLYEHSYRLAIISNTHRYQDAYWIRNELATRNLLQCFEVVVSSATYAVHKPNLAIFQKTIDFMQVTPEKVVMVGDSVRCDGAAEALNCTYMQVAAGEDWATRLYTILHEDFAPGRKLSSVYEHAMNGDIMTTTLRHLSEPLAPGDRFLINEEEHRVVSAPPMTKHAILAAKHELVDIVVEKVAP
jgi:predicted HAD superfamily phosphohydrolase YqeG